jgi:zinc finger (C-x8-C-x5-C-x3-H type) protein
LAGKSRETLAKEREKELRAKEKADEEKRRKEEAELFKPVQAAQKVPFGVDPKMVLCEFFKAGRCEKGSKCKFSHDRDVGRRVEKKNLYEDNREDKLTGASCVLIDRFRDIERQFVVWPHRHYGQVGRGEVTECHLIQARESTDNY